MPEQPKLRGGLYFCNYFKVLLGIEITSVKWRKIINSKTSKTGFLFTKKTNEGSIINYDNYNQAEDSFPNSCDRPRAQTDAKHRFISSSMNNNNLRSMKTDDSDLNQSVKYSNHNKKFNNDDLIWINKKRMSSHLPAKKMAKFKVKPSLLSQKVKLIDIRLNQSDHEINEK